MEWDMRPLDGAGGLKLGMTSQQVAAVFIGQQPITGQVSEGGDFTREVRGAQLPICSYNQGKLFMIDTHPEIPNVTFAGQPVYECDPEWLLQDLEHRNNGAQVYFGYVVFASIGVNTQDFYLVKERTFFQGGLRQDTRGLAIYMPGPETSLEGTSSISFLKR